MKVWIRRRGFRIPNTGLQICKWNLDSGFQSLARFRIPGAVFRIPQANTFWVPDCTTKSFLDFKIRIPLRLIRSPFQDLLQHQPYSQLVALHNR